MLMDKMPEGTLSDDFMEYFNRGEGTDVIINTKQEIHAHSQILCARSEYFRTALSSTWAKRNDSSSFVIQCEEKHAVMHAIVTYLYSGTINLAGLEFEMVLELLKESEKLLLNTLSLIILENVLPMNMSLNGKHIVMFVEFMLRHDNLLERSYHEFCYIMRDIKKLVFSTDARFSDDALRILLERDDLGMKESELWEMIQINGHEIVLGELRFHQFENDKIVKLLLPELNTMNSNIVKDVLSKKLDPPNIPQYGWIRYTNIDHISKILKFSHIDIINKMLEVRNSRLELVFAASRCETRLTGRDLYERIKGLKSLMIIGRDNTYSKIYGGYNPESWNITMNECEEVETYHSFIFLIDAENLKDYKIARPINYGRSLTNNPDWGPGFENTDLQISRFQ